MTKSADYRIEVILSFDDLPQEFYNLAYNSQEQYVPGQITEAVLWMTPKCGEQRSNTRIQPRKHRDMIRLWLRGDPPPQF